MGYGLIFDLESDGLLPELSTIHVVSLRKIESDGQYGPVFSYEGDDIDDAVGLIEEADYVVGHNIISFDLPAVEKMYPDFKLKDTCKVRDTLVLARMCFANEKDHDYRRFAKGTIPGKLIGRHELKAWGYRLGVHKGDYAEEMIAAGLDPWKQWDRVKGVPYCEQDVEVTTALWEKFLRVKWSEEAVILEHQVHELMFLQETFGFKFDRKKAEALEKIVRADWERLTKEAEEHFGTWMAPKKMYTGPARPEYGEDDSRQRWGEVEIIKKTICYRDKTRGDRYEGNLFCNVVKKDFNPNSRPMIIDRLKKIYDWEPTEFTENGNPTVDDEVLRGLAEHWAICDVLAECFFLSKLLGALSEGSQAWLKACDANDFIHAYVNVGGTRSGRASHSYPNLAQVPKVKVVDVKNKDGSWNKAVLGPDGNPRPECFKDDGTPRKSVVLKGRAGRYGFECRSLFIVPDGWWLMGSDLKGVEMRNFAHHLAEFDNGEYMQLVLSGDPHAKNQQAFGVASRDQAKTAYYAMLYGGGDEKMGSIVLPPNTPTGRLKQRGKELKHAFQVGLPAYGALIKKIQRQGKQGTLPGLDGRLLYVKSRHSALNLQLQSDGAIIAKKWNVIFNEMMEDAGYRMGWGGDYVPGLWIHDEIQVACRTKEIADHAAEIAKAAALAAGEWFNYRGPIEADAKVGRSWMETH